MFLSQGRRPHLNNPWWKSETQNQRLKRLRTESFGVGDFAPAAKAGIHFRHFTARLEAAPFQVKSKIGVFPQPLKAH
jgi:hypothetical protein